MTFHAPHSQIISQFHTGTASGNHPAATGVSLYRHSTQKAFSSPKRRKGLHFAVPLFFIRISAAYILNLYCKYQTHSSASITGRPASVYDTVPCRYTVTAALSCNRIRRKTSLSRGTVFQQKDSKASWEITLLPCTVRQLSGNDTLLILLFIVSAIFPTYYMKNAKISQVLFFLDKTHNFSCSCALFRV